MIYSSISARSFFLFILLTVFSFGLSAQIKGGYQSGQTTPAEVKAGSINVGGVSGDVNLFTGTYSTSQTLGTVSCPSGLSYTQTMSYNSTHTTGDNLPQTSGIPYGEGWSMDLPMITVSTEDYTKYTVLEINDMQKGSIASGVGDGQIFSPDFSIPNCTEAGDEGGLHWFAPTVSIPGVASGRMIYKGYEAEAYVFVLHKFERYIEARLSGDQWKVILDDGTIYTFDQKRITHRNASNQRVQPNCYGNQEQRITIANLVLPKTEILAWYCGYITNPNKVGRINFKYETHGKIDFFKTFTDPLMANAIASYFFPGGGEEGALAKPAREVILEEIDACGAEKLSFNHRSISTAEADNLVDLNNMEQGLEERFDSMYTKQVVNEWGSNQNQSIGFQGWQRFNHLRKNLDDYNPTTFIFPEPTNPYLARDKNTPNNSFYIVEDADGSSIPFDHSFLESPRIGQELTSGDLYEVEALISTNINGGNHSTFDFNIVTGDNTIDPDNGLRSFGGRITELNYTKRRYQSVFSTFNQGLKAYNNLESNNGSDIISGVFMMPNLPSSFDGFNVQIGPGISDSRFDLDGKWTGIDGGTNRPPVCQSYYKHQYLGTENRNGDPVPNNFGIGMPWDLLKGFYASIDAGGVDTDSEYCNGPINANHTWFNTNTNSAFSYDNIPTKADDQVALSRMRLIRYVKNPYMLIAVKKFIRYSDATTVAGSIPNEEDYWTKVNHLSFAYDVEQVSLYSQARENEDPFSPIITEEKGVRNIFRLRKIIQNTQDDADGDTDLSDNPTTFLEYENTDYLQEALENIYPADPNSTNPPNQAALFASNNSLLTKIISPIGGTTEITYQPFGGGSYWQSNFVTKQRSRQFSPTVVDGIEVLGKRKANSFGIQIFHIVDRVEREDHSDTQIVSYEFNRFQTLRNENTPTLDERFRYDPVFDDKSGFGIVKVTGPRQYGQSPYQRYVHHTSELLWGKIKKVESYDGQGQLISESESVYEHSVAFEPYMHRIAKTGTQVSDYCDYATADESNYNCNNLAITPRPKMNEFPNDIENYNIAIRTFIEEYGGFGPYHPWTQNRPLVEDHCSNANYECLAFHRAYQSWFRSRPVPFGIKSPDFNAGSGTYDTPSFYETHYFNLIQKNNPTYAYSFFIKKVRDIQKNYDKDIQEEEQTLSSGGGVVVITEPIEQITEYDYYEADYSGEITDSPYNLLFELWGQDTPERLLREPSWQLYATKSYSPQLGAAETFNENFYLFDFRNNEDYYTGSSANAVITEFPLLRTADNSHFRNSLIESKTTNKYPDSGTITKSTYLTYATDVTFVQDNEQSIEIPSDEWPCESEEPIIEVPSEPGDPTIPNTESDDAPNANNIYLSKVHTQVSPSPFGLLSYFEFNPNTNKFEHIIPVEHITNIEILERNIYGQVAKEVNERGIITKYDYNDSSFGTYETCSDGVEVVREISFKNFIGLPTAVTVGYDREDELRTEYSYDSKNNLASVTDPNGTAISYTYDEYGRLAITLRNGEEITSNSYSNWKNDEGLTFKERVDENYLSTINYVDQDQSFTQKAYIDPLGRSVGSVKFSPGVASVGLENNIFDLFGRPVVKLRPDTGVPTVTEDGINRDSHLEIQYDAAGRNRPIRSAKFGESINGEHVVTNNYAIVNAQTLKDNLTATGQEETPPGSKFYYTSTKDEDGKIVREFRNALGQTVATITNNGQYGTLFFYNTHGSVKKVYSPMKKISDYKYNYLGQMYEKQTPDTGKDEYAYDYSGLLIGEKQANNTIRAYTYDDYGRQLTQVGLKQPGNLFGNQGSQWLINDRALSYLTSLVTDSSIAIMAKKMVYGNWDPADEALFSFNLSANLNPIENTKGRVAETISYDPAGQPIEMKLFSYNNDGFLDWEVLIGNYTGIKAGSNNQVTRITYPEYNLLGAVKRMNVSFRFQGTYEFTYRNTYDDFGRIEDVYVRYGGLHNGNESRIVNYEYNDAAGAVARKKYYDSAKPVNGEELPPECENYEIDMISYGFDDRFRMTGIESKGFSWNMSYDDHPTPGFIDNYNGNINQTIGVYKVGLFEQEIPLFDGQTTYDYRYDQVNRLTTADATVTLDQLIGQLHLLGDVDYLFNKDGDFQAMIRGELNQQNQAANNKTYSYSYLPGTSKLEKITVPGSAPRTFMFDQSGNLLKDIAKGIGGVSYTRTNLPSSIISSRGGGNYRYNTADERIYKTGREGVEYYVRNALGQELVVRTSGGAATWYVFGNERVAKIQDSRPFIFNGGPSTPLTPENCETPPLECNEREAIEQQESLDRIEETTTPTTRLEHNAFPTTLRRVRLCDGSERYLFEDEIDLLTGPFHLLQVIEIEKVRTFLEVNFGEDGEAVLELEQFMEVRWRYGNELIIGEFSGCPIDETCNLETFECTKEDLAKQAKDKDLLASLTTRWNPNYVPPTPSEGGETSETNNNEEPRGDGKIPVRINTSNVRSPNIMFPTYLYLIESCDGTQQYVLSEELQQLTGRYPILQQVEITHLNQEFDVLYQENIHVLTTIQILMMRSEKDILIDGFGCKFEREEFDDECEYTLTMENHAFSLVPNSRSVLITWEKVIEKKCTKAGIEITRIPEQKEVDLETTGLIVGKRNEIVYYDKIMLKTINPNDVITVNFNPSTVLNSYPDLAGILNTEHLQITETNNTSVSQMDKALKIVLNHAIELWMATNNLTYALYHFDVVNFEIRSNLYYATDVASIGLVYGGSELTYFDGTQILRATTPGKLYRIPSWRSQELVCNKYLFKSVYQPVINLSTFDWPQFNLEDPAPTTRSEFSQITCEERIVRINSSGCDTPIGIWNGTGFESCNYTFTQVPTNSPVPPTFTPESEPVPVIVPDISYYIHDHLGNTRIIYNTDRKCGERHLSYHAEYLADYYPYGKILREYTVGKPEKYLTTHHERDQETGLDYRGARFYDSDIGRFLSVDPLAANFASYSPYNYVLGNPVMLVDPDGRLPIIPIVLGVWAVAEIGLAAYDAYDVYSTVTDPNATNLQKAASIGGATMGMFLPGGGYSAADDVAEQTIKVLDDVADETVEAAFKNSDTAAKNIADSDIADDLAGGVEQGSIYKVPGKDTPSGDPYVGSADDLNKRAKTATDGRNRDNAEVIGTYDKGNRTARRKAEQKGINENGGVRKLDNKRNEVNKSLWSRYNIEPPK